MPFLFAQAIVTAIALALLAAYPAGAGPVVVIAGKEASLRIVAAADGLVLSADGNWIVATSDRPGFAGRLYAAGATLVLAAPLTGLCASRSTKDLTS
jgi:hypothetical protein